MMPPWYLRLSPCLRILCSDGGIPGEWRIQKTRYDKDPAGKPGQEYKRSGSGGSVPADGFVGLINGLRPIRVDLSHFFGKSPGLSQIGVIFSDKTVEGLFDFLVRS